ncbi:MAG: 4-hydroxythreonine-4-phosphate dehydrogenase PdxA [Alphaproteobacteria bacterium]|nr:4-hydroxythreonine-4-phosphate dehydrogenase PdxA [Alphaproteobacteria bacterium]
MAPAFAAATAVTMGEPAGIGPEITLKAWLDRAQNGLGPFFLIADPEDIGRASAALNLAVTIAEIQAPEDAATVFSTALPVLRQDLSSEVATGAPNPANAAAVLAAIERAATLAIAGTVNAVVTNPIHKETLAKAGFRYSGHTDYLGHLAGGVATVMMLVGQSLKVVPATVHVGLREAIASLTPDLLIKCAEITAAALRDDFAIPAPRLVFAGLNPHAGEGGMFGFEETMVIEPAVDALRQRGFDVRGPLAADSLFHAGARTTYDAAICMYHDQALIPIKTLEFDHAVNMTLGLPFVRTSPDHGTAFDIAGKNVANPTSLVQAILLAQSVARTRFRGA